MGYMAYMAFGIILILTYLVGNISPAIILSRLKGIDIRSEGSGNPGATNVLRVMGVRAALITLIIDVGKGFLTVKAAGIFLSPAQVGFCALAVFTGHVFPVFMGFKGGKGVATAIGTIFAINVKLGLILICIFLVMLLIFRIVSLGSVTAAISFIPFAYIMEKSILIPGCIMVLVLIVKHRKNIKRIFKGEESRLHVRGKKKDGSNL